jgi:formylglycine-generating enzyme required for sulfatase activity
MLRPLAFQPATSSSTFPSSCRFAALVLTLLLLVNPWLSDRAAAADPPGILSHQGRIAVDGTNFDGAGQFKFALVNAAGNTTYWSNDGSSTTGDEPTAAVQVTVTKGHYSVLLGDSPMGAIPASVFADNDNVSLRVWFDDGVNGSQQLTPDRRIAAVGYAMVAGGLAPGVTIPASAVVTPPPGMVLIPAGEFTMGDSLDGLSNAVPISTTVSAFYMDVNEVTLSQWQSVYFWANENGYTDLLAGSGKGANHPAHTVTWYDCVKWCNARSEQAGLTPVYYTDDEKTSVYRTGDVDVTNLQVKWSANGYRLPTEAEWEKAARGGLSGQRFPWGNTITQNLANYYGSTGLAYDDGPDGYNAIGSVGGTSPATSPVGSFAANGYGLNDMAGNVFEWCWDWYGTPYTGGADPHGPATGSFRVLRGGGWFSYANYARCAYRFIYGPGDAYSDFGFRAVLAPGQP